jgi:hypothetical protein
VARSATGRDAPDPSLAVPIRNIVKSAHKWGGDGKTPDFDKIKRVLMSRHPEVIAKAFGGNANKAAAWIKDNWMALHGRNPTSWRGKKDPTPGFSFADLFQEVPADLMGDELFFADDGTSEVEEKDGLLWYPICRTGTWVRHPTSDKPLLLTIKDFEEVKQAFDEGAWEFVTIPLTHNDRVDENTGFIKDLEIRPHPTREGVYKLWAGHSFTEPDVAEKVKRGTIAGRSVYFDFNGHKRTEDGKFFPKVLKHVALTNRPWLNGINEGETLAASYEEEEPEVTVEVTDDTDPMEVARTMSEAIRLGQTVTIIDGTKGGARMPEDDKGKQPEDKTPEKETKETVTVSKEDFEAMMASAIDKERQAWQDRFAAAEARLQQTEDENRKMRVADRIAAYQGQGVAPAILSIAEEIMLADTGSGAIKLSQEDGNDLELSHSDVVLKLLDAMPGTALSQDQPGVAKDGGKPPADDEPAEKKAEKLWEELQTAPALQYD